MNSISEASEYYTMWKVRKRWKGICLCENLCEKIFPKSAKMWKIQIESFP